MEASIHDRHDGGLLAAAREAACESMESRVRNVKPVLITGEQLPTPTLVGAGLKKVGVHR